MYKMQTARACALEAGQMSFLFALRACIIKWGFAKLRHWIPAWHADVRRSIYKRACSAQFAALCLHMLRIIRNPNL